MVDPQNIEEVKNWVHLNSVTKVRSFVGLASYYRRFIMNFASIATHLTRLTKKEVPIEWTEKCDESFQKIKTLLTTTPILALPVEGKSFNEVTDFVKKVEGVRRDGQDTALAKKPKRTCTFHGFYSRAVVMAEDIHKLDEEGINEVVEAGEMVMQTWVDLVILDMTDFDIILGMTWLSPYYDVLNCNAMSVTLEIPGREKLEWKGLYKPKPAKVTSFVRARKLVGQWCLAYLAHIHDVDAESPSIESIPIVSEFKEVFPTNLPSMPLDRDIDFCINLEPVTHLILHSSLFHGFDIIERG
ncbi:hypothetical protein MTR67_030683 [Solanum verrucosum]|uniref:Gag-pol polyprotein n=1 Tax=Solanum verrucosum TaxID=315347 RepID=A0AAF0U139_SOLVR|nr:hypothetical protein MTR67_030683 [Solanum verrucosum]